MEEIKNRNKKQKMSDIRFTFRPYRYQYDWLMCHKDVNISSAMRSMFDIFIKQYEKKHSREVENNGKIGVRRIS